MFEAASISGQIGHAHKDSNQKHDELYTKMEIIMTRTSIFKYTLHIIKYKLLVCINRELEKEIIIASFVSDMTNETG